MRPGNPTLKLIARVDRVWDFALERFHQHFGYAQPINIVAFDGSGTRERIRLEGRVLADRGIHRGEHDRGPWRNFSDMMKRYASYEVPRAKIIARFRGTEQSTDTDAEGFYRFELRCDDTLPDVLWHPVELELVSPHGRKQNDTIFQGWAQVPPRRARFGVISDVDDTIVHTGATDLLAHARIVLFNSARSRRPFAGVSAFYAALQNDPSGEPVNPIWYVSSSPWNIYDLISEFMEIRGIPRGTLLMKDFGIDESKFIKTSHREHKLASIAEILATYPDLSFILIGDTGQADAEIYHQAVLQHPGRVLAVYLRDVGQTRHRARVVEHADAIRRLGVETELIANTVEAAVSAARLGLITEEEVEHVREDRIRERARAGLETIPE